MKAALWIAILLFCPPIAGVLLPAVSFGGGLAASSLAVVVGLASLWLKRGLGRVVWPSAAGGVVLFLEGRGGARQVFEPLPATVLALLLASIVSASLIIAGHYIFRHQER